MYTIHLQTKIRTTANENLHHHTSDHSTNSYRNEHIHTDNTQVIEAYFIKIAFLAGFLFDSPLYTIVHFRFQYDTMRCERERDKS